MPAVLLAFLASLAYGVSDFVSGLAARILGTMRASLFVYVGAVATFAAAMFLIPWTPSTAAVIAGLLAGVSGTIGLVAFYGALAVGPMSLLSPAMALLSALVPVAAALLAGDALSPLGITAIALAATGTCLIAVTPHTGKSMRISPKGALLALIAGTGVGLSIVALDAAPANSGMLAGLLETVVGAIGLGSIVAVRWFRNSRKPDTQREQLAHPQSAQTENHSHPVAPFTALALAGGILMGASNMLIILALRAGELAIVSVVISLYPLSTVILARVILHERISALQATGVVVALVATALLGLA